MTFEKIKEIIVDNLAIDEEKITLDTRFKADLGVKVMVDAGAFIDIIMTIEDCFGIEISDEVAEKFVTVGDIVRYVDSEI